jgi:hypothetical protein
MESNVANGFFLAKFKRNTMDTYNNLDGCLKVPWQKPKK